MTYDKLSTSQREAVCCEPGPCEIIAGPGSGKTTVLIEHILYLIGTCRILPEHILVLTFSRAAAKEMRDRFVRRIGSGNPGVTFGTFHSVFYQILRNYSDFPVRLIDDSIRNRLLYDLLTDCIEDPSLRPDLNKWETMISSCRASDDPSLSPPYVADAATQYDLYLKGHGYLDYDDIIQRCLHLLQTNGSVRGRCRDLYPCVLVDEFQDVNREQYEALKLLCGENGFYCVGDDDQSIYGFRGSSPQIMRQFCIDYPSARQIHLTTNYRCDRAILLGALKVIGQNEDRISKKIRPAGRHSGTFSIVDLADERAEFAYMADKIRQLSRDEREETAVIFRTNAHAESFTSYLSSNHIPYHSRHHVHNKVIASISGDLLSYLTLSGQYGKSSFGREELLRVMNRPERGLRRLYMSSEEITVSDIAKEARRYPSQRKRWNIFLRDLHSLSRLSPYYFLQYLYTSMEYQHYAASICESREEAEAVADFLLDLLEKARQMRSFPLLVSAVKEAPAAQTRDKETASGVHIVTMHASKGLEYDRVFIPCLNEGIFPGRNCHTRPEIEEERRLFYVSMTRARHELTLLYAKGESKNARHPSRFLEVLGVRPYTN